MKQMCNVYNFPTGSIEYVLRKNLPTYKKIYKISYADNKNK